MAKPLKELDTSLPPEEPDAWERFESAVDKVVRGGPQHRNVVIDQWLTASGNVRVRRNFGAGGSSFDETRRHHRQRYRSIAARGRSTGQIARSAHRHRFIKRQVRPRSNA
jgi:hypothetical protein